MTIQEWLKDIHYDDFGQHLWSKQSDGNQLIGQVRGFGALRNKFETRNEAEEFQDAVGQFIADAINEKIKREYETK